MKQHKSTVSCLMVAYFRKSEEFILSGSYDGRLGQWDVRRKGNIKPHLVSIVQAHVFPFLTPTASEHVSMQAAHGVLDVLNYNSSRPITSAGSDNALAT